MAPGFRQAFAGTTKFVAGRRRRKARHCKERKRQAIHFRAWRLGLLRPWLVELRRPVASLAMTASYPLNAYAAGTTRSHVHNASWSRLYCNELEHCACAARHIRNRSACAPGWRMHAAAWALQVWGIAAPRIASWYRLERPPSDDWQHLPFILLADAGVKPDAGEAGNRGQQDHGVSSLGPSHLSQPTSRPVGMTPALSGNTVWRARALRPSNRP